MIRIAQRFTAELFVQVSSSKEPKKKSYRVSWVGKDEQKGTLSFRQDSMVSILQPGDTSKAQLQIVEFKSFAVLGTAARLGTFCYKANGASKEIKVGQLAQRVFKAQVLASSTSYSTPAEQQSGAQNGNAAKQQPRRSLRQHPTEKGRAPERSIGTRKRTLAESAQRARKDKAHKAACVKLTAHSAAHPEWLVLSDDIVEKDGRQFQMGTLTAEANCPIFGARVYAVLTASRRALSFACCNGCRKVFTSLAEGGKHRCLRLDEATQPVQRQRPLQLHLEGGIQPETHLLHQVRTCCTP